MSMWAKQRGFTIVELLIVIVVVAILAAITIVAYNGIQNRAKQSAAQTVASQAAKKLVAYSVISGDIYPQDKASFLSQTGLSETDGTTYQYTSVAPHTSYCLTTTSNSISYYTSNANGMPTPGGCSGHGINGVPAITNLVTNPSLESNLTSVAFNQYSYYTHVRTSDAAHDGTHGVRLTIATAGASIPSIGPYINVEGLSPASAYVASAWVRASKNFVYTVRAERRDSSHASLGTVSSSNITLTPNVWTRISLNVPATPNMTRLTLTVYSTAITIAVGDTIDVDGLMLTEGSTLYNFADGKTAHWAWHGTPDNSTSTGPPL